tara:strand:+ start:125 stop:1567 length:1443 start_codon:yes stop_codon:yes gene_type:complete
MMKTGTTFIRFLRSSPAVPVLLAAALTALAGCGEAPPTDLSLPSKENLYEYSIGVARRARSLVPSGRARALFNTGFVHERFGMEEKAEELFREGLELDPITVDVYESLAQIYSLSDRSAEAIKACHMALRYDPNARGIWTRIGQVLSHMQRHEEAIEAFRTELRRGTGDAWTRANLGLACKALDRWEEATAAYQGALELDPGMREALYGMAESLRRLDKAVEADTYLERWKAIKKKEEEEDLEHRQSQADDLAQQKAAAARTWLDAANLFITEHNLAGDNRQRMVAFLSHAKEALEESLQLDPTNRTTHIMRLDMISKTGTMAELITATSQAVDSMPEDPFFSLKLAESHLRALGGKPNAPGIHRVGAQRAVRKTLELSPGHAQANGLLAEMLLNSGATDANTLNEALSCAKKAVDNSRIPNATAYNLLARTYFTGGLFDEARKALEEGIRRLPEENTTGRADLQKRLNELLKRIKSGNK